MLRPLSEVLVVTKAVGEVCDRFKAVCVCRGDQRHKTITDISTVLCLVCKRASKIAYYDDQYLFDQVRVERYPRHLAELDKTWPLINDESDGCPQGGVGFYELAIGFLLTHLVKSLHLRQRVNTVVMHPLLRTKAECLGFVLVVENLLVHLPCQSVLGRKLILDSPKLEVAVRIADGLLKLVTLTVVEIFRCGICYRIELVGTDFATCEESVNDLAGMMPAGKE